MDAKHTRNLSVADDGSTLYVASPEHRCIGTAYGWNETPEYDADGKLINRLTSNDEARANARLWAAADDLAEALREAVSVIEKIKPPENGNGTIVRGRAALEALRHLCAC